MRETLKIQWRVTYRLMATGVFLFEKKESQTIMSCRRSYYTCCFSFVFSCFCAGNFQKFLLCKM